MQDKKAILSFTTGSRESMFKSNGINGDMNVTLWPLQVLHHDANISNGVSLTCVSLQNGILHYCGFQVLAPQIFWAPSAAPAEQRAAMLEAWRKRLQGLLGEEPLSFVPLDCFDEEKGFELKHEVCQKNAATEFGLAVGIHLGKRLPLNNQMKGGV